MSEIVNSTQRLYFKDVYLTRFQAQIISRLIIEGAPAVVLDQTCFYPEGGGQPSDLGWLNEIPVKKVLEQDGEIIHLLETEIPEDTVNGKIDWEVRFDHMQQHAGQHILSQCFHELFQGKTLSFHLGKDISTLEIGLSNLSEEQLSAVERQANRMVFTDIPIKTYFVEPDRLDSVPLRKPPQKTGAIRVVEVAEFDYSACGGTHPCRTGEIGLIKILKKERIRNNLRFEFVCGYRALRDYTHKNLVLGQASTAFSVRESDLLTSIQKLMAENKSQKRDLRKVQEHVAKMEAQTLVAAGGDKIILRLFAEKTVPEMRLLALSLIRHPGLVVVFGQKTEQSAHVILARSDDLELDLRALIPEISSKISGKGGGRPSLIEMAGANLSGLKTALDHAYRTLSAKLTSP